MSYKSQEMLTHRGHMIHTWFFGRNPVALLVFLSYDVMLRSEFHVEVFATISE